MNSRFVKPAEDELAEAFERYRQIAAGLGERFLNEARQAVAMIEQFPDTSPVIASDVRKKILLEFPYSLFYRVAGDGITILAVAHHRQRPHYWRRRSPGPNAG